MRMLLQCGAFVVFGCHPAKSSPIYRCVLDHGVHEDDSIRACGENELSANRSLQRVDFSEVCHCLSIPVPEIVAQEPWWHAMNYQTSAVSSDN